MKKKSVDFLIDQLSQYICFPLGESSGYNVREIFDKAREMHYDEIINSHEDGHFCCNHFPNLGVV